MMIDSDDSLPIYALAIADKSVSIGIRFSEGLTRERPASLRRPGPVGQESSELAVGMATAQRQEPARNWAATTSLGNDW